jgi:hypothetical protein
MDIKKGASLEGVTPQTIKAIEIVDNIYLSFGENLTVTSGTEGRPGDGVHKHDSLHYTGNAFDCRIWVFKKADGQNTDMAKVNTVAKQIREALGKDYDVLVEADHIHIEYDPKTVTGKTVKDIKRLIDIIAKFLADITPFYRMIEKFFKDRK